jgi:ubiquinone/menaquinone biosynthesis C-methylase UbiE
MTMNETILLENRAYWTQRAPSYSEVNREELATEQRGVWKQVLTEQISARFPGRTPEQIHILEIDTGPGFFAILLAEAGYRVTAIDLTPSMLEEARRNAGMLADRIDFIEMNAEALSFPSENFDVILSRNVTWNLLDPELAYAEWARVLKPGGLLMTFDANWYAYLFDDEARVAYAQDRENSVEEGLLDLNVGDNFDRMEQIAREIPLSRAQRPTWDIETLMNLGLSVKADTRIWDRVWSHQEKVNFASTPMFLVCGEKQNSDG